MGDAVCRDDGKLGCMAHLHASSIHPVATLSTTIQIDDVLDCAWRCLHHNQSRLGHVGVAAGARYESPSEPQRGGCLYRYLVPQFLWHADTRGHTVLRSRGTKCDARSPQSPNAAASRRRAHVGAIGAGATRHAQTATRTAFRF